MNKHLKSFNLDNFVMNKHCSACRKTVFSFRLMNVFWKIASFERDIRYYVILKPIQTILVLIKHQFTYVLSKSHFVDITT